MSGTSYILKLQNKILNKRWSNEIEALEEEKEPTDKNLIELLKKNIKTFKEPEKKEKKKKPNGKKQYLETKKKSENIPDPNDMTTMWDDINKSIYMKPWLRLHKNHKKIKLNEYIDSLVIKDASEKKKIKKLLIEKLENKELQKKNVEYSISNSKIEYIFGIPELDKYQPERSDSSDDDSVKKKKKKKKDDSSEEESSSDESSSSEEESTHKKVVKKKK